jgi:DNA-binding transcriptional ArsR family regulator
VHPGETAEGPDDQAIDPLLIALLQALHDGGRGAHEPTAGLSFARLAKRLGIRQSTLRRNLSLLEEAGLARIELEETGGGRAMLTPEGVALCTVLGPAASQDA